MRELGYVEGRDFDMTYAMANFDTDRLPQVAAELVELAPDVILAGATLEAVAARKATARIPIVVGALADPVAVGFATSDARPTGNVTGITPYVKGLPAKQLELARELVPGATRIGLVNDVADPKAHPQRQEIEAAGGAWSYDRACGRADRRRYRPGVRSLGLAGVRRSSSSKATCCSLRAGQLAEAAVVEEAAYGLRLSRACRGRRP